MLKFCLAGLYPLDVGKIAGGVEHVTYMLSQTFSERRDIDLHVLALVKNGDVMDVVRHEGVTFHRVGMPRTRIVPNLLTAGARLAPVFRAMNPDVVNSHDCITTDGALRAGCKVVHTIHGIKSKEARYLKGRGRMAAYLHHAMESRQASKCSALLAVAQYGLDCFSSAGVPGYVINVPVEDVFFDVPAMGPAKGILFVGSVRKRKNVMAAIQAMPAVLADHPDATLYVCGDFGEPAYAAEVRAYVAEHSLERSVQFAGLVDRETVCDYLAKSRCLILPSRQETSPGVICQAMAAGRVPIASPVGGVPEMIDDGVTGFIVPEDDSEKLAHRIIELMDDSSMAKRMGSAAKVVALERYDRHKVADRILGICSSVAACRSPLPAGTR